MTNGETLSPKSLVLLRHLNSKGCFAKKDALRDDGLALYRVVSQVTLGAGLAPLSAAEALMARGFAQWDDGQAPRLLITPAGKAACVSGGDSGTSHTARQAPAEGRRIEISHSGPQPLQVNMNESPLMWLHRRKGKDGRPLISAAAFAAGERLRADITMAGTLPRVTSNWTAAIAQGPRGDGAALNASEAMLAATQRVQAAARAVGPEFSGLLIDVCGFLKGLELVERERGWPPRSAKLLLVMGLTRLAAHYGLSEEATGKTGRKTSVWRSGDARPHGLV
jgi:Domain of unknown function (DUF6456)